MADNDNQSDGGPPSPATRSSAKPVFEIVAISIFLALFTVAVISLLPIGDRPLRAGGIWAAPALAAIFGSTMLTVFRIEFRNNAIVFSLSEIPLAFALVYLAPWNGIGARVIGSAVIWLLIKRPPVYKTVFNLAMFGCETAVAYYIVQTLARSSGMSDLQTVAVATGSVSLAGVVSSLAVPIAVSRFTGDTVRNMIEELKTAWILVVNGAMAGAVLSLYLISPVFAALSVVPVVALWYMMRRHGELAQRLRDLRGVHGFAGRIGRSLDLDEIGEAAVAEASRLLRADVTVLMIAETPDRTQVFATRKAVSTFPQLGPTEWSALLRRSSTALLGSNEARAAGLSEFHETHSVIVAPVDDEIGPIGALIMARQSEAEQEFRREDLAQAQNLAEQLASSLRKGLLHRRIEFEARHDALTDLPNRASFERRLAEVAAEPRDDTVFYLLMMDLDRFKEVNDTLGHHAGDDLLVQFSHRVADQLGPDDFLCRLAGDEFAVIASCPDDEAVFDLARSIVEDAARPVTLDGLSIVVTASVGIAPMSPNDPDSQTAMRHADIAMYNAKSRHMGVDFFRPELDRRTPARLSMLGDLREAIEKGELGIEYQPKLDLGTGLITGAEALVRWNHIARGIVSPDEFVRVAEDTGLIKQLTDSMLARGIVEMRRWHQQGHHLTLSVNLSTHDLLDSNLASRVGRYLSESQVHPGSLTLEITESSLLIDAPRTQATIHDLHALGVRLSIDDFGTGYSSLSYLRRLPVSELKVDQSFIANMLVDQQDEVIVRSTIDLGHNLGLEVVAEGVENTEILDRLRDFRCDVAQGYCISRPLTAARFTTWLNTTHHPSRRADPNQPETWVTEIEQNLPEPGSFTNGS